MKATNTKIRVGEAVMLQVPAVLISRTIKETMQGTEVLHSLYETTRNANTNNLGSRRWNDNSTERGVQFTAETLIGKNCTVEREA